MKSQLFTRLFLLQLDKSIFLTGFFYFDFLTFFINLHYFMSSELTFNTTHNWVKRAAK